jgi:hypothetical protein
MDGFDKTFVCFAMWTAVIFAICQMTVPAAVIVFCVAAFATAIICSFD